MKRVVWLTTAIVLFASSTCAPPLTLNFQKATVQGASNTVVYYTGFRDSLRDEKVVLCIRGTGRFEASSSPGANDNSPLLVGP